MLTDKPYIIGIDLGTTNSAVSYVDLEAGEERQIRLFRIPQMTAAGEFSALPVLPSFLYIPGTYDIAREAITIPWKREDDNFAGAFARDHGAKVPARLVSSAKSWLCHSNVDRKARILPWGSGDEVFKVSPVQATAAYLRHIRQAWNSRIGDDPDRWLENQNLVITVPASFDEAARELTLEAASLAGLQNVTLLEEPLAAFYNWLIKHEHHWSELVKPNELILVCDVGGGTTDFTLITLRPATDNSQPSADNPQPSTNRKKSGSPRFERIAVGDHLILGGDNIDLALARKIEAGLSSKKLSLSGDRWKALCHECRRAKEMILNKEADSKRITLMGEGGKLIGGTISATLTHEDVEETILRGFFPLTGSAPGIPKTGRKGITEFGLPYQQDPGITRHLIRFLKRHKKDIKAFLGRENCAPDLILFNGGSLKSDVIQERIRAAIREKFGIESQESPRIMENPEPDLSVALGAAYYGLVKIGEGVRVGSGSARSFYLGIEVRGQRSEVRGQRADQPLTSHPSPRTPLAICLIERGLDEGTSMTLPDKRFDVLANQLVSFDLFSSSFRSGDRLGDLVETDDSLTPLPRIRTVVQYGKKGVKTTIPVQIEASYTEAGTLALWLRSCISNHRWRLQFQLRGDIPGPAAVGDEEIFDETVTEEARNKIRYAFTAGGDASDSLVKDITAIIERPKEKWPLGIIRSLADELLDLIKLGRVNVQTELRWLNLTGFCLRPGFGHGFDEHRIKKLWRIYKLGPVHKNNAQIRSEWWILWRRAAGGLKPGQQRQFIQDLSPIMLPKKDVKPKIPPQEHLEIWMAVANMEQLLVKDKILWGKRLLSELRPKKTKAQLLWSLSRIGARELFYGPADRVIPQDEVSDWIEKILSSEWSNPKPVGPALAFMGRMTGDRMRDIDETLRNRMIDWLNHHDLPEHYKKMLTEPVRITGQVTQTFFGESLPSGIILRS